MTDEYKNDPDRVPKEFEQYKAIENLPYDRKMIDESQLESIMEDFVDATQDKEEIDPQDFTEADV